MPYLLIYGLLALWLLPSASMAAGEAPLQNSTQETSDDYPEDFSLPAENSEALENRYAAFGEEEASAAPNPAPARPPEDLMRPIGGPPAAAAPAR